MNDLVREYCELACSGVAFDDVRLAALRDRMSDADLTEVKARLRAASEADFREAEALRVYGRIKFEDGGGEAAAAEAFDRVMFGQPKPKLRTIPGSEPYSP
jgi:hypothetical protein